MESTHARVIVERSETMLAMVLMPVWTMQQVSQEGSPITIKAYFHCWPHLSFSFPSLKISEMHRAMERVHALMYSEKTFSTPLQLKPVMDSRWVVSCFIQNGFGFLFLTTLLSSLRSSSSALQVCFNNTGNVSISSCLGESACYANDGNIGMNSVSSSHFRCWSLIPYPLESRPSAHASKHHLSFGVISYYSVMGLPHVPTTKLTLASW